MGSRARYRRHRLVFYLDACLIPEASISIPSRNRWVPTASSVVRLEPHLARSWRAGADGSKLAAKASFIVHGPEICLGVAFGCSDVDLKSAKPLFTLSIISRNWASVKPRESSCDLYCINHETGHRQAVDHLPCKVVEGHLVVWGELGEIVTRTESLDGVLCGL